MRPLFSVSFSGATTWLLSETSRGRGRAELRSLRRIRNLTSAGSWKGPRATWAGVRETAQIIDALAPLECSVPDLKWGHGLEIEQKNGDKLEVSHNKQIDIM